VLACSLLGITVGLGLVPVAAACAGPALAVRAMCACIFVVGMCSSPLMPGEQSWEVVGVMTKV
jgi:hypothetical protein